MRHFLAAFVVFLLVTPALSLARQAVESPAAVSSEAAAVDAHPVLSTNINWMRNILSTIVIMFILAALVGPVVRKEVPQEMPPVHSHDEPPGASHHHGPGGTADPNAPDVHHH